MKTTALLVATEETLEAVTEHRPGVWLLTEEEIRAVSGGDEAEVHGEVKIDIGIVEVKVGGSYKWDPSKGSGDASGAGGAQGASGSSGDASSSGGNADAGASQQTADASNQMCIDPHNDPQTQTCHS
jgi:hypothetical protein